MKICTICQSKMENIGTLTIYHNFFECPHCGNIVYEKAFSDKCCALPSIVYLKLKMSDGRDFYKSACTSCGTLTQIKKQENTETYDDSKIIEDDCRSKKRELDYCAQTVINERKIKKQYCLKPKTLINYDEYIKSPEWYAKRKLVLERDKFLCQRCKVNKAVHVHHITYANIGNEYLYELVSVCWHCHKLIHTTEKISLNEHNPKE